MSVSIKIYFKTFKTTYKNKSSLQEISFKVDNLTNNKLPPPFAIINSSKKCGISLTITDWVRAKQLLLRPATFRYFQEERYQFLFFSDQKFLS